MTILSSQRCKRGFTLIELLVVIAILVVLAGLLLPTLARTRERARLTACENNLHEFAKAIIMYRNDFGEMEMPDWLSDLHPRYLDNRQVYLCPADRSRGADGARPADIGFEAPQLEELDDPNLPCSYEYQFAGRAVSAQWDYRGYGITNVPANATWKEVKFAQMRYGDINHPGAYDQTVFPMMRCFHHWATRRWRYPAQNKVMGLTINVAYAGNIFHSPFWWELPLSELQEE